MKDANLRHDGDRQRIPLIGTLGPRRFPRGGALGVVIAVLVFALGGLAWLSLGGRAATRPTAASGVLAQIRLPGHIRVCGVASLLGGGPTSAPRGAIVVRAGDDSRVTWTRPGATYWFAPGLHTLGRGSFTQIQPGPGATFIGAPGAVLDGQHHNYYAFAGESPRVTISYLTIENFGTPGSNMNQGVVNHNSARGWTVDHSTVKDNAGAGVMLGTNNRLTYDCLENNQQYGFNAYSTTGPSHLLLTHNEIAGNDTWNWEARDPGCGCTGGGKFWDVNGAVVTDNWIHGNHSAGLWADTDNRGFDISDNYIADNYDVGLIYEISYNAQIVNNVFVRNGVGEGPKNSGFPTSAIYISESGSDSQVPGPYKHTFAITGNTFINNWGGVILWENSNRFCNSPANTSTGSCTLVSPRRVTLHSCNPSNVARTPYYSECRWKTQNVSVEHNVFYFNPTAIGASCVLSQTCGYQGVFSEYGTFPHWSPYRGTSVENHITFDQDNHFADNRYYGPWHFMALQLGDAVTWNAWLGTPYRQDADSTLNTNS